jgi:hypothetical protein
VVVVEVILHLLESQEDLVVDDVVTVVAVRVHLQ